jgi:hypothetical protein
MTLKISPRQLEAVPDVSTTEPVSLDARDLLLDWEDAKTAELTAAQRRAAIEQQLALLLPAPEEGQKSHRVGPFRVTRTNSVYYKGVVDLAKRLAAELELPSLVKEVMNETALKRLRRERSVDFELLMSEGAISMTPARPHFEVARVATARLETT